MHSGEVPVFDRVVSEVKVVSVIVELSDATLLVSGIRPICKHHSCNGININYNGNVQKIVLNLNTIAAYFLSLP
jgi:hypothetical protein